MITIGEKNYKASQVVDVRCDNEIPIQPVEEGFDVQDHIRKEPLQVRIELIIFEEETIIHGTWGCSRVDGRMVCDEMTGVAPHTGTYAYLVELRDNRETLLLDCSDYAREASMIYPDMAITHLGQLVQRGSTYYCTVIFTQITKHVIVTESLYIQEVDTDDPTVKNIRWSKEPIEPTNIESPVRADEIPGRYGVLSYGRVHRVPTVWQVIDNVIDLASTLLGGKYA